MIVHKHRIRFNAIDLEFIMLILQNNFFTNKIDAIH